MNDRIGTVTMPIISEKKSNSGMEAVALSEDFVLLDRNPTLDEFVDYEDVSKVFVPTYRYRFFRTKDKRTVFQQCFQNTRHQIVWVEKNKVYLVKEGGAQ